MPSTARKRVVILPDLDHMLWHIRKEDFATNHIFGKTAVAKGAIAGSPGKQVWAIWVRRYYGHPDHIDEHEEEKNGGNVLYVLRLVVEGDETANIHHNKSQSPPPKEAYVEQTAAIKAVLRVAQAEAAEWRLNQVRLCEPPPLARSLLEQSSIDADCVERHGRSIAGALWFTGGGDDEVAEVTAVWVNNEYYAWLLGREVSEDDLLVYLRFGTAIDTDGQ